MQKIYITKTIIIRNNFLIFDKDFLKEKFLRKIIDF